jgi:hypothetical protein
MHSPRPQRKPRADESQLALPLAWLGEDEFLRALRARGVDGVLRVRFRPNRTRLISLSADSASLNLHECFRSAPDPVIDAIAAFLRAGHGSREQRAAVRAMRGFSEGQLPEAAEPPLRIRARAGTGPQRDFLAEAYRRLNAHLFEGRLPEDLPLRWSDRMARRYGHVEYRHVNGQAPCISELALNVDLMLPGNERHLLDTLVHEMAHVEAWVLHGQRGHGPIWRRIARRAGCEVRALSHVRIRRRRDADPGHVPDLGRLLARARRSAAAGAWRDIEPEAGASPVDPGSRVAQAG